MNMSLLVRTLYPTNTMQLIILLLMSFLVSTVTTFSPFDWVKDAFDYEHCGSVWIKHDTAGTLLWLHLVMMSSQ